MTLNQHFKLYNRNQEKGIHAQCKYLKSCSNIFILILLAFLFIILLGATEVVVVPSHDYTTFLNNALTFTFNCSGNGKFLFWTVDGHSTATSYVLDKGINYTQCQTLPNGFTVSSLLIVPTTEANKNITVICTVLDQVNNHFSSDPVKLILQGTFNACYR